ncbi:MAG TPA: CocE/NonD family hydrolase [Rugosimonospora sp.]|nr:CocE/NonD family hydrolase [Rugosimonospora sp.]
MDMVGRMVDRLLGLAPAPVADIEVWRGLRVPMPEGAVLLADRYAPADAGPMPVVLVRGPYGRGGFWGAVFGGVLARQGLQVLVQSVRGTFGSEGVFDAMHQERADGLATAAWVRAQPWCDGRLAGAGLSYLGYTQWALAPYLDPPLHAACLAITASEFNSHHYPGGAFNLYDALSWTVQIGRQEDVSPLRGQIDPVQQRRTRRAEAHLPLRGADTVALGRPSKFWQDVVAHAEPGDGYWAAADHSPAVARLTTPVTMATGWYDLFLPWQLRDFRTLREAGRTARVTIGPWAHSDPPALRADIRDQVQWLRAHLLGDALPGSPAVRAYLQHADRWLEFAEWPPAATRPTPLYLHPGGALDWQPAPASEPDSFVYDPSDPTPSVGGPLLDGRNRQRDNRPVEARPDVLVYTSAPLPRDLDLMGDVSAAVHVRTEVPHADVYVRLCDVDTRGVSRNISDGILRLRPGAAPVAADGTVTAAVGMWPTGYRLRAGHRLRVQVAGGAFPRFARNHGTGEPVADAVTMRPCRHEVHHDPAHPTHLLLPVLG